MDKLKFAIAFCISIVPCNGLRTFAYRMVFGYKIINVRIGFGTIIKVESAEISNSRIGRFNRFSGPMSVLIKDNAIIGSYNRFQCDTWTASKKCRDAGYARSLEIHEDAFISSNHYFDIAGAFVLGEKSWIAGRASQFWTHGAGTPDRDIHIGKKCYVASAVRFSPGSEISDNVLVAMGSVLTKRIDCNNCLIAGVPAKVLKENYDWKSRSNISRQ